MSQAPKQNQVSSRGGFRRGVSFSKDVWLKMIVYLFILEFSGFILHTFTWVLIYGYICKMLIIDMYMLGMYAYISSCDYEF